MAKSFGDVRRRLLAAGWTPERRRGSHEIWKRAGTAVTIVVAGRDSATVPAGTLASIRRASGLDDLR